MKRRIIFFSIVILVLIICLFIYNKNIIKEYKKEFSCFNKTCEITIFSKNKEDVKYLNDFISKVKKLDQKYSSELKNINKKNGINLVSKELYEMLKLCDKHDLLVNNNALIKLWENSLNNDKLPDNVEIQSVYNNNDVILLDNNEIKSEKFDLNLDNIMPSYIINEAKQVLDKNKVAYMFNFNGNITVGNHYKDKFKIGLFMPITNNYLETVEGNNLSVYSVGMNDYKLINGLSYTSVIDFETLYPYQKYLSVSVISNNVILSQILSNKLFTMSIEDGKEYVKDYQLIDVIWILNDQSVIHLND